MGLGTMLAAFQKSRIDGPFQRVHYIDPNPNKMLMSPKTGVGKLCGFFALGCVATVPALIAASNHHFVDHLESDFVRSLFLPLQQFVETTGATLALNTQQTLVLLGAICALGFVTAVFMASHLIARAVAAKWRATCERTQARVVDSEIQEIQIAQSTRNVQGRSTTRFITKWEYRLQVAFTYRGADYQATPSVVNRIQPGTASIVFDTPEACQQALAKHGDSIALEFNPRNPLDADIAGHVDSLAREQSSALRYLAIFLIAIAGMAGFFLKLTETGR